MPRPTPHRFTVVAALILLLGLPGLSSAGDKPPCAKVISAVNRNIAKRKGAPAGSAAVAKEIGSDVAWVERCMRAYGRIPAARHRKTTDFEQDIVSEQIELGEVRGDEDGDDIDWDEAWTRLPRKEPRDRHPKVDPERQPLPTDKEYLRRPDLDEGYWRK